MNFAFTLCEEVVSVTGTSTVFERMAGSILLIEEPSINKVFAWSRLLENGYEMNADFKPWVEGISPEVPR